MTSKENGPCVCVSLCVNARERACVRVCVSKRAFEMSLSVELSSLQYYGENNESINFNSIVTLCFFQMVPTVCLILSRGLPEGDTMEKNSCGKL